jgi:hypothetical protein
VIRSINKNPATQRHVPEELNPQQHRCEYLKSDSFFFILLKSYIYVPNERKCNLCSFHIRILKQLRHTDVILPSLIIWNSLLIRSNSINFSRIFFCPTPYLKPTYTVEEYEIKDILNPEDWITEDVLLCASASRLTFLSRWPMLWLHSQTKGCIYWDISGSKPMGRGPRGLQRDYSKESANITEVHCRNVRSRTWLPV